MSYFLRRSEPSASLQIRLADFVETMLHVVWGVSLRFCKGIQKIQHLNSLKHTNTSGQESFKLCLAKLWLINMKDASLPLSLAWSADRMKNGWTPPKESERGSICELHSRTTVLSILEQYETGQCFPWGSEKWASGWTVDATVVLPSRLAD